MAAAQGDLANASLVRAMQARLESLVGRPSGLIETLPKPIQRRIKYLTVLQEEYDAREEEYQRELDELDRKYAALYAPIFAKRAEVVSGQKDAPQHITIEGGEGAETGQEGVPGFWLGVLQANEITSSKIQEKDEAVLESLLDMRSEELYGEEECGFKLTFEFAKNSYFENSTLTKTYHMVDSDEPVLERAEGSKIDWKAGKNVTVKTMKRKPKPGRGGKAGSRPITKTEPVDSFFTFFSPPDIPEDPNVSEDELETLQSALEEDYEVGETMRDELIPNAVRWYTGEIHRESDEEEEDDEEDEEGEEGDSDEGDDDKDSDADARQLLPADKAQQAGKVPVDTKEQPPECKQQ